MNENQADIDNSNDKDISLVSRAAATAGLITAGMGFPNIWKMLEKNYSSGLSANLLSTSFRKDITSAEITMVLGKAALDIHKDPAILGSIAKEALKRDRVHSKNVLTEAQENLRLKEFLEVQKNEETSIYAYHDSIRKKSLFDRVYEVERELNSKSYGRKPFQKNINGLHLPPKSRVTSPAELKRSVVIDVFENLTIQDRSAIFPGLKNYTRFELDQLPLIVYEHVFDGAVQKGGVIADELGKNFLALASHKNPNVILHRTPKGQKVTLGGVRASLVSTPLEDHSIRYNLVDNFMVAKKKGNKYNNILFGQENIVADVMTNIENNFAHIGIKEEFGSSKDNIRKFISALKKTFDTIPMENRAGKEFGVRLDTDTNSLVVFTQHNNEGRIREHSVRVPLPNKEQVVHFNTTSRVQLTNGVSQHGRAIKPVSSFERTSSELEGIARHILHGTYIEERDKESLSLQTMINRLYEFDRLIGNSTTDYAHSKMIRSTNPFLREHGRMKMNRISGLTQHNVLAAAQRTGKDILMYDQEFIAGREGPQVSVKNPHTASPYQISYRRVDATGKILHGKTIYIKTHENQKAIDAYLNEGYYSENADFVRFKKSLSAIGKGDAETLKNIVNEIQMKGVSADEAYHEVFNIAGANTLLADYGGQGGPDREIIKFQTGRDYIGQSKSIDIYKMLKAGSSTKRGWSLQLQFADYVRTSSDSEFRKLESTMLSHADTISHRALLNQYKDTAAGDHHNRRQAMIQAVVAHGHDASVDTAMQCVLLDKLMARKPLMGALGSSADRISRLTQNPTLNFRDKINAMNESVLSAHFYGDKASEFGNIMPTGRSDRQIITGANPGVGANSLDLFEIANSGMKQIHQKFYGIKLLTPNKEGKFLDPFTTAFRKQMDHMGSNAIGDNIAINSESVMSNVYLVPQGYGDFYDGSIIGERHPLSKMMAEREMGMKTLKLGKVGEIRNSAIDQFLSRIAREEGKPDLFQDGKYLGTQSSNDLIAKYIQKDKVGIAEDMQAGRIDAGMPGHRYGIKQNDVIARTFSDQHTMTHGYGRISHLSFAANHLGELEMSYNVAQLVGLEKTWVAGTKANVELVESVDSILGKASWEVAGEVVKNSLRPVIVASYNMFKRGEIGTAKKVQAMRIYTRMMAQGHIQKATNFLQSITSKTVYQGHTGPRIDATFGSVEEHLEAVNNISEDKLYHGMIDAGLTWDHHSMKLMAEHYKVNHAVDIGTANDWDKLVTNMWEKDNGKFSRSAHGGNYTELLDSMMENNELNSLRGIFNPFFHKLEKKIVNPLHTPTARYFDPRENIDSKGRRYIIPGIMSAHVLETIATTHMQVPGVRVRMLRASSYFDQTMKGLSAVWEGSFTQKLLNNKVGAYRHETRKAAVRFMSIMQGTSSRTGAKLVTARDFDMMLRRTLANRLIIKDMKDPSKNVDPTKLTRDQYSAYMKQGWEEETSLKYTRQAEALRVKANMGYMENDSNKQKLLDEAAEMERRAGDIMNKPLQDYGSAPSENEIKNLSGTLLEHIDSSKYMRQFSDSKNTMHMGSEKIAPHDLILLQTKGVSNVGNKKFWTNVVDQVVEERRAMGDSSPQIAKKRAMLDEIIKALDSSMHSYESDHIVLPTMQLVADLEGLSISSMTQRGLGWNGLTHKYMGVLTAVNELQNAKGGFDFYQKNLHESLTEFSTHFIKRMMGKKLGKGVSLMFGESQYHILGIRGQVKSPFAAITSVKEQLNLLQPGAKANKGEMEIGKQKQLAELLESGQYGFIDRDAFDKLYVGDIKIKDFLIHHHGEAKYKAIRSGRASVPLLNIRNPIETGTQGLFSDEYYVYNNKDRLFKNMPKGIVPSLKFLIKAKADTDGDEMGVAILNMMNVKEMNKVLLETRHIHARENAIISEFHKNMFRKNSVEEAQQATKDFFKGKKLHGLEVQSGEMDEALRVGLTYLDDFGHILKRAPLLDMGSTKRRGYTLTRMNRAASIKVGKLSLIENTKEALKKYGTNIDLKEHIMDMVSKMQVQNIGKEGIGIVASHATRTNVRFNVMKKYIGDLHKVPGLSNDIADGMNSLRLFPNLDFKNPVHMGMFHDVINTYQESMGKVYDQIGLILRGPEQHLISTKKQINADAGEMMFRLIENITHIHEEKHRDVREFFGINFNETQLSAMREGAALDKTLRKYSPHYAMEVDDELSKVSSVGIGAAHFEAFSARHFIRQHISKITSAQWDNIAAIQNDTLKSGFAEKTASAWRNSVKQLLFSKQGKTAMGMSVGLALMTVANPNQMSGGIMDFGIDLGHKPGFSSQSGHGGPLESLDAEPGNDVFQKKWAYMLKNDPILKDNIDKYSDKSYKNLDMNSRTYAQVSPTKKYKRNYIDYRKSYNKRYITNDMRRAEIPSF